jgi:hypothetical protein
MMAIIQRQGVGNREAAGEARPAFSLFSENFTGQLRNEFQWVGAEGERLLESFLVPPMQVVAAALNFVTLLVSNRHFIDLPLQTVRDFKDARLLVAELNTARVKKAA